MDKPRNCVDNGWMKPHQTSWKEIKNLMDIVDRDMLDAGSAISTDWRFGIAYVLCGL